MNIAEWWANDTNGHEWHKGKDGEVVQFVLDYSYHNGPLCDRCGYSFCEHCDHRTPDEPLPPCEPRGAA